MRISFGCRALAIAIVVLLVAGCKGSGGPGGSSVLPAMNARAGTASVPFYSKSKIKHVVIIIQESRSFNNLFYGYPGAKTVKYGYDSKNRKIVLQPIGLATKWGINANFLAACNGAGKIPGTDCKMNGFNKEMWGCGRGFARCPIKYPPYSYVPHDETKPYFDMAKQYVLADEMYASNYDASMYVAHQYLIAAQAHSTTNYPLANWGCPGGKPDTIPWILKNPPRKYAGAIRDCFDYKTLGDELDEKGDAWAFYANRLGPPSNGAKTCGTGMHGDAYDERGIWSAYQAVKHLCYGPDWDKDVISPQTQFFSDIKHGDFRAVTWITPAYTDSDYPSNDSDTGPTWVASLVNAIGESKFWDSTAIFVVWDGFGGWYDPEPPAYVDYEGLGIRVPLLIVSPYAKKGLVSHVHYEDGSILKFAEDQFGLARLAASDARANTPEEDCFNFKQPPRKFMKIADTKPPNSE